MKRIIYSLLVIVMIGCEAIKNLKPIGNVSSIQQVMLDSISLRKEFKTYSLNIPETWYSFKEVHGHIMHSPQVMQKRSANFYENNLYVKEYSLKVAKANNVKALFEYYHEKKKSFYPDIDFIPKKLLHENYGSYYLIKYGTSWSKTMLFTNIDVLFHYQNRNFILSYTSENKYYDEFIKEVEGIVNSFTIKELN